MVTFRLVGAGKFGVVGGRVCLFPVTVASWARVSAQPLPSGGDVCLAGLGSGFGGQVGARGGWEMKGYRTLRVAGRVTFRCVGAGKSVF